MDLLTTAKRGGGAILAALLLVTAPLTAQAHDHESPAALKAAILRNFLEFARWPTTAERAKFQLCALGNAPTLIVADFPAGAQLGATLALDEAGGRIVFDVNLTAARRHGLQLDIRLIQLARRVY
jgi:hypothetical protein